MNDIGKLALKLCATVTCNIEMNNPYSIKEAIKNAKRLNTLLMGDISNNSISRSEKKAIVKRLQKHLTHENDCLVQAVSAICIQCTEDNSLIDEELAEILIQQANLILASNGKLPPVCAAAVLEILTNLVLDSEAKQTLLKSSGCLNNIIDIFFVLDFEDAGILPLLNVLVNVTIAATCIPINNTNKKLVCKKVVTKMISMVQMWKSNPYSSPALSCALKEILFLCVNLLSSSEVCQNMFCEYRGFETFKSALDEIDRMHEHMEIKVSSRRSLLLDKSQTLFESLVSLLDVAVTHNSRACRVALNLGLPDILIHYLDLAPSHQKGSVVSCLAHLFEVIECPNSHLWESMLKIVNGENFNRGSIDSPVLKLLKDRVGINNIQANKRSVRKGTPHPKKFQVTCTKESPKKFKQSQQVSELSGVSHSPAKSAVKHKTHSFKYSDSEKVTKASTHFINMAELLVLLKCIRIHGVNMHAVRELFPFHKELSARDLYVLWRSGIWKKKLHSAKHYH